MTTHTVYIGILTSSEEKWSQACPSGQREYSTTKPSRISPSLLNDTRSIPVTLGTKDHLLEKSRMLKSLLSQRNPFLNIRSSSLRFPPRSRPLPPPLYFSLISNITLIEFHSTNLVDVLRFDQLLIASHYYL